MKAIHLLCLFFCISLLMSCRKKEMTDEFFQLPAETTKGANTVGCLVYSKAILPKGSFLSNPLNFTVFPRANDGFAFNLDYSNKTSERIAVVRIEADEIQLKPGTKIILGDKLIAGQAWASYSEFKNVNSITYTTTAAVTGELNITYFNADIRIVSGTFSFDAVTAKGAKTEVRKGRFDLRYW